jgi:hypothetical protein
MARIKNRELLQLIHDAGLKLLAGLEKSKRSRPTGRWNNPE